MNIRKNADYTEMYAKLESLMKQQLPQMELYCTIGKAVCERAEKGAAVMAAEYLHKHYPDVSGFSPRNVRRMRDFYRTYESYPQLLKQAMQIGWIQNMVIMEADLTMELREWYMRAAKQLGWSKTELIANIAEKSHENIEPVADDEMNHCSKARNYCKHWGSCLCYEIVRKFHSWEKHKIDHRRCLVIADNTC